MRKFLCCLLTGVMLMMLFSSCRFSPSESPETSDILYSEDVISTNEVTGPTPDVDEISGYIRYESENGTQLAPVLDIQGQFVHTLITSGDIYNRLADIKKVGYTRVYIVVPGDGYPVFSAAWNTAPSRNYLEANRKALGGDPLKTYIRHGHQMGLEMIAIYKIYEGGGGVTVPEGKEADNCTVYEDVPGGRRVYFDSFIQEHPEMRLIRRDDAHLVDDSLPVDKIEVVFLLDDVSETARNGSQLLHKGSTVQQIGTPKPELWVSTDNGTYVKYEDAYQCNWKQETRDIYDANNYLFAENQNVYVLTVEGMDISDDIKYFALLFSDADKTNLLTNPFSLITLYSGDSKLVTSATAYTRCAYDENDTPENHEWGDEISPYFAWQYSYEEVKNWFSNWGFEFEYGGDGATGTGWMNSNIYGITRGKPQYLPGVLCEGYAEVREHWLNYVKYLCEDLGFDGVDIRMLEHSGFVTDVVNYGYNEPILERYSERYGTDLTDLSVEITPEIFLRIAQIRGEFLLMFYQEAAEWLHANDKLFIVDLLAAYEDESMWDVSTYDLNQICSPYQPRILPDWKACVELADEIILKDYHYGAYNKDWALPIKIYAQEQGKVLWMHVYAGYNDATLRFVKSADQDATVGGLLWYEYNPQRQREIFDPIISSIGFSRVQKNKN